MKKSEFKKAHEALNHRMSLEGREGDFFRARSVTVGSAGGGTTEIMMRLNSGHTAWQVLQPVEVIEFIHQLAANIGCHIAIKPREDFASWRQWKADSTMIAGNGWPPFVNDLEPHKRIGADPQVPNQQPGLAVPNKEQQNVVATEKTVNRRSTKRAAKTA